MAIKITVHRGAEEIGGNCIEMQSGESRILLDYGAPLPKIDPVTHKNIEIPLKDAELKIPGLYADGSRPPDGLIISHTHQDHYGMLYGRPVNPEMPVYMSRIMEEIVRLTARMGPQHAEYSAKMEYFSREKPFKVGAFTLTPYLMDHSASESFGFLIEAEGKRIFYTGDYREHGHRIHAFQRILEADMGRIDLMLTEGTQAAVDSGENEKKVMADIEAMIKPDTGTVYVMCSGQNIDLLCSLGGVAAGTGRYLAVDPYVALVLETLKSAAARQGIPLQTPGLDRDHVKVLDTSTMINVRKYYPEAARKIEGKLVAWSWVRENLRKLVVPVRTFSRFWVEKEVRDFKDALFVYSQWEGYKEEVELARTLDWFKSKGMNSVSAHVSGHAYFSTIRKLVDNKKPALIVPIHTEHPEKFAEAFGDRVRVLNNGGSLEI